MRVLKWSVAIGFAVLLCARDAVAQEPSAAQPLVIERIRAGFIVAPDFKVTMLDDQVGELAGGYAARVLDNTLIVGGAGYWLVNDARDFRLTYGGLLLGWSPPRTGRIRFGGRAVVGVGTATLGSDLSGAVGFRRVQAAPVRFGGRIDPRTDPRMGPASLPSSPFRILIRDEFFVFEPQASAACNIAKHIALDAAAGYHAVALTDGLRNRLDGPTANVAIQFGW